MTEAREDPVSRRGLGLRSSQRLTPPEPESRAAGTITSFDVSRASGFIRQDHRETELFFRQCGLRGTILARLAEGERLEFEVSQDTQGPVARDLVRLPS